MEAETVEMSASSGPGAAGCPVLHGYDPVDPATVENPFPWLAKARESCPVFYVPAFDFFCVSRYEDVLEVLRQPIVYSNLHAHDIRVPAPPDIVEDIGEDYVFPLTNQLNVVDPPQHTRMRKLIQPTFTPKMVSRYEPALREISDRLVDEFAEAGRADFATQYARRLPALFIASVIGAPLEDAERFHRWIPHFFMLTGNAGLPEEQARESWKNVVEFDRYTKAFVEGRRADPRDDLTSDLIAARTDDGEPALTDQEITANTIGFIGAGSDNSATLMTQMMYQLLRHPDQWDAVKADRTLIVKAIDETMRFRGPLLALKRTTTEETVLGGITLPKGSDVMIHLASANRDETVFPEPDRFDIHRESDRKNVAWGLWTHFCVGAPLAKLEAQVALEALIDRLPGVRLAEDQGDPDYSINFVQPMIESLKLEWDV